MIAEQQFFIQILKDHLEGSETKQCPDIEWKKVLFFAQIHQVEGIVFYQSGIKGEEPFWKLLPR